MRFQCLEVTCGKAFGWTAKKIVSDGDHTTFEYVVCPYCGSLDFDETPKGTAPPKPKQVPPMRQPTPATIPDLDQQDLMNHNWKKGKKKPDNTYAAGNLSYGWDFKDKFKPETLKVLEKGPVTIDLYVFTLQGNFVSTKKAK